MSSTGEGRMPYAQAYPIAKQLWDEMRPFCEKATIAGSLRRRSPDCGDIELVALPRFEVREIFTTNIFGEEVPINLLHEAIGTFGVTWPNTLDPCGRMWKGVLNCGLKLEIYLPRKDPVENWGLILAIRTGPWKFSQRLVTQKSQGGMMPEGWCSKDGMLWAHGKPIPVPSETALFELLGVPFVPPEERK